MVCIHERRVMSGEPQPVELDVVANEAVWGYTGILFLAALLFFLVNIGLGFLNALTSGPIADWQIVTHLHTAALGWFTLSVLGLAVWVFTGERDVSDTYVTGVRLLTYLAILAVVGYVASFALAFNQGGDLLNLLPIFGGGAVVVLWAAAIYAVLQLRHQRVVTNVHAFLASALVLVSIGGTMGVLVALNRATGAGIADVGAHAPVMLFYLLLVASAVVEWFVAGGTLGRWNWPGLAQALAALLAGIVPAIAISLGIMQLMPLLLLGLVAFFLLFLGRVGWKALYTNPLEHGTRAWTFFGALWLVPVVLVFPAEIAIEPPEWFLPVVAHLAFVGMASNLLFAVLSERTKNADRLHAWAEPGAMWLLNLGLLAFVAALAAMDARHGALVMGLGALVAVIAMLYRLLG